jgi:hypothetical protein
MLLKKLAIEKYPKSYVFSKRANLIVKICYISSACMLSLDKVKENSSGKFGGLV